MKSKIVSQSRTNQAIVVNLKLGTFDVLDRAAAGGLRLEHDRLDFGPFFKGKYWPVTRVRCRIRWDVSCERFGSNELSHLPIEERRDTIFHTLSSNLSIV